MKSQTFRKLQLILFTLILIGTTAVPAASLEASRRLFSIPSGNAEIEAELVIPEGGSDRKGAVIFSGGSGAGGFQNYVPGFNEELLESLFLPRDIAVLYINKRGVGESTGNWKWGSIERRTEDALAAAAYLRQLPEINPEGIGLAGHSQGGWVVMEAGGLDPDLAFIISLSGPTVTPREQDMARVGISLKCEGATEKKIRRVLNRLNRKHERRFGWVNGFQSMAL
jgi:dipeptidyl aminopeptidase/acylaminoacyl peptidase